MMGKIGSFPGSPWSSDLQDNPKLKRNSDKKQVVDTTIIDHIEAYIKRYLALSDEVYSLPIALWIAATYAWETFDVFPYLCITSLTKQSGKTLLANLMEFSVAKPENLAGLTPAAMFHCIEEKKPVLFFDEAEILNSEAASMMRSVLNVGYRRGTKIQRISKDGLVEYETYCPKVFILIGDVYDTLRDRSIIIRMKRGKGAERFNYAKAKSEGQEIRDEMEEMIGDGETGKPFLKRIEDEYRTFLGLPFLQPRDEEIWTPLFVLCRILCPMRITELTRCAVDMSTEKTQEIVSYRQSATAEEHAESEMYAQQLIRNILQIADELKVDAKIGQDRKGRKRNKSTLTLHPDNVVEKLKSINDAPWRKYKHNGLTRDQMTNLLSRHFGIKTYACRIGNNKPVRVYDLVEIQQKANETGITTIGDE